MPVKKLVFFLIFFVVLHVTFSDTIVNSFLETGVDEFNKSQYNFAISNLKKYVQLSEDSVEKSKAYYYLALSYYFLENYDLALNFFKELSIRFKTSNYAPQSYFWNGLIYQNKKQPRDSEEAFQKFVTIYPTSELIEKAYLGLINAELEQSKYNAAERNCRLVIDKFYNSEIYEEVSVLYAYILIKNNKPDDAFDFLSDWIGKLGKTGENYKFKDRFWLYYAEILFERKDFVNAEIYLKKIDSFAQGSPSSDITLMRLAKIKENSGSYKEAKEYLRRIEVEFPDSKYGLEARINYAIEDYYQKNYPDSITLLESISNLIELKLKEKNITRKDKDYYYNLKYMVLYYSGDINYKLNNTAAAINKFIIILERENTYKSKAITKLAEIYSIDNNITDFIKYAEKNEKSVIIDPIECDKYYMIKAKIYFINNKFNDAAQIIENINDKKKYFLNIVKLKVNIFLKQEKYKEAVLLINQSLPDLQDRDKAYLLYDRANINFNSGNYSDIITGYEEIIKTIAKIPDNEQMALKIKCDFIYAISLMTVKDYDKSLSILHTLQNNKDVRGLSSDLLEIINKSFYYSGWIYYKTNNFTDAGRYFVIAGISSTDDDIQKDSSYMEAMCYFSARDYQNAVTRFESIYKKYNLSETGVKSFYQSAKCYENLNSISKSFAIYKKIYEEFPESDYKEYSLFEMVKIHLQKKQFDLAGDLIKKFEIKYPISSLRKDILVMQGEVYLSDNRFSEAFSVYNFYLKKYPDDKERDFAYYWAGYSAYKIDDLENAKGLLEDLVSKFQSSSFIMDSMYILERIYYKNKDFDKQGKIISKLLTLETDKQKTDDLHNKQNELDLINKGLSQEEANYIIESKKGNAQAKYNLGALYYKKGDKGKALPILKELSDSNKQEYGAKACILLGDNELDSNNYNEALKLFLKAVSGYKSTENVVSEALYKSAFCYVKLQKNPQAKKIIDQLKKDFPGSEWTGNALELEKRYF